MIGVYPKELDDIQDGLCHCGCGERTTKFKATNRSCGQIKGKYAKFVVLHHNRVRERQKGKTEDRFWRKVDICGSDECWEWTGSRNEDGYGHFLYDEKVGLSHRYFWRLHFGGIPDGLNVLHRCDNPPCVNPKHLFLGTQKDNALDRNSKGRRTYEDVSCEKNANAKLTNNDVWKIRRLLEVGNLSHPEIANMFGVNRRTISSIKMGAGWKRLK